MSNENVECIPQGNLVLKDMGGNANFVSFIDYLVDKKSRFYFPRLSQHIKGRMITVRIT
jgi:hypothetical protein